MLEEKMLQLTDPKGLKKIHKTREDMTTLPEGIVFIPPSYQLQWVPLCKSDIKRPLAALQRGSLRHFKVLQDHSKTLAGTLAQGSSCEKSHVSNFKGPLTFLITPLVTYFLCRE